MRTPKPPVLAGLAALAAVVAALVLGVLMSGVQATTAPSGVPVAVAVPPGAPPGVAERIAGQGDGRLAWRVTTPDDARRLLDEHAVYGVLQLAPGPNGSLAPTVIVSGAVNPAGTQAAQQALTAVAQAIAPGAAVPVETVRPASVAARALPVAASQLLWIGCLVGSALVIVLSARAGRATTVGLRLASAAGIAVGAVAAVLTLVALWERALLSWELAGFLLVVAAGFAALQAAVLRLAGLRGMALLGPLFLLAPAVASQVPELLNPGYRVLLWSWSPFRFAADGVRGVLQLDGVPADVRTALWVFAAFAVAGLVVLVWPGRRPEPVDPEPATDDRVPVAA